MKHAVLWIVAIMLIGAMPAIPPRAAAQAQPALPAEATLDTAGEVEDARPPSFIEIVKGSGTVGILLWLALLGTSLAGIHLVIDSFVKIKQKKIMPPDLVDGVQAAMSEGDLPKAIDMCQQRPGIMANILMAGFANVEEGFDVIQDSINAAADLESERLLQKVTYLSVVSNMAPMLGLMGTVQGMIFAFATLATGEAGAAQQAMLAMNISQALYTTMTGLGVAVPAVAFYYFFRNKANNIILTMVIRTIDLVKVLRNVEVVDED